MSAESLRGCVHRGSTAHTGINVTQPRDGWRLLKYSSQRSVRWWPQCSRSLGARECNMRAEQRREGVTEHARDLVGAEALGALRPPTARLLSEHTLLAHGEPGLQSWRPEEAQRNLREAVALIEAAESLRETDAGGWAMALRRAGDILEWLTTPPLLHADATLRLLAAAAFQLAGFPVIAGRYLTTADIPPTHFFRVFQALLSADFPGVLRALAGAWRVGALVPTAAVPAELALSSQTSETVAGAAGLLAADMRWGAD